MNRNEALKTNRQTTNLKQVLVIWLIAALMPEGVDLTVDKVGYLLCTEYCCG